MNDDSTAANAPYLPNGEFAALPGADLIRAGVGDLQNGIESVASLLVSIGSPRLRRLGIPVTEPLPSPELRLYQLLGRDYGTAAHSKYNALIRTLVSFERGAECGSF